MLCQFLASEMLLQVNNVKITFFSVRFYIHSDWMDINRRFLIAGRLDEVLTLRLKRTAKFYELYVVHY